MMPSAARGAATQQQQLQQNSTSISSNGQQQHQQSVVAPVRPQSLQAAKRKLAHVLYALEDLRLDYLHSSVGGLPLPTTHQLEALARLRPSSLNACPDGVIPTWSHIQTTIFGNVFLECMWKASHAIGLPLDAYLQTVTNEKEGNEGPDHGPLPSPAMDVVKAFNLGLPTYQIAKQWAIDESSVLAYLLRAEEKGNSVQWSRMTISACLKDAVVIAAEVARHLEKAAMEQRGLVGGVAGQRKEPLSTHFPLPVLMQLLPDWRPVDVLAGICLVRNQQQTRFSVRRRRLPPEGAAAATSITATVPAMAKTRQLSMAAVTCDSSVGGVKFPAENLVLFDDENHCLGASANASSSKEATKPMQQQQQQQQQFQQLPQVQPVIQKPAYAPSMELQQRHRHPQQQQHQQQYEQQQQQQQQHQQQHQLPANPPVSVVPLPTRILTLLQVHAASGLSSAECCELLASADRCHDLHVLDSKTRAAVEACLGELEEAYVAYRGADGKFKLL